MCSINAWLSNNHGEFAPQKDHLKAMSHPFPKRTLVGYHNPIPLDETVDASLRVGEMLPAELRYTALGGLATTPSALALPRFR